MPPRIPLAHVVRCNSAPIERSIGTPCRAGTAPLVSLLAALSIQPIPHPSSLSQARHHSILSDLRDNKGAYNKRIRVGRGASSGYGKTSGRGTKGQGQHGKVKPWFQGGQTPLIFKHGQMGFINRGKEDLAEVNLTRLQAWIDRGRIDASKIITPRELIKSGLVGGIRDGVKLLLRGRREPQPTLKQPLNISVSRASASAIAAVEAAGGTIITRYYTKKAIENLVSDKSKHTTEPLPVGPEHVEEELKKLEEGPYKYRLPDPVSRWHIEYYRDPAHRGYLSNQIKPGETPSLFFKVPTTGNKKKERATKKKTGLAAGVMFELR